MTRFALVNLLLLVVAAITACVLWSTKSAVIH